MFASTRGHLKTGEKASGAESTFLGPTARIRSVLSVFVWELWPIHMPMAAAGFSEVVNTEPYVGLDVSVISSWLKMSKAP